MKASVIASSTSYRVEADTIRLLTPIEISHTATHSMTQKTGQTVQNWMDNIFLMNETLLKKKVPVLYIEGDALLLSKGHKTNTLRFIAFKFMKAFVKCETNHRPYSYRMKRQGRNFKSEGAGNLAAIISRLKNGTLVRALTETIPEIT